MSETLTVGNQLVDKVKAGDWVGAYELYADDIVSVEAADPSNPIQGLEQVKKHATEAMKGQDMNSVTIEGPFPLGDKFAVYYAMEMASTNGGEKKLMKEVALYQVKAGKVVREEFMYSMA